MPPATPSPAATPSPTPTPTPTPTPAAPLTKTAHSTSNSPVLRSIQSHLNLTHNDALFTALRTSAHTLLADAGILLASANDQAVQIRKRQVAHELEKLHPEVFGAGGGAAPGVAERTYEMRKNTSYALLTLTMDVAKRRMKRRRGAGGGGAGAAAAGAAARRTTPSPSPPPPQTQTLTQLPLTPTPTPTPLPAKLTPPPSAPAVHVSPPIPTPTTPTPTPTPSTAAPAPPTTLLIPLPHPLTPRDCCRVQLCDLTDAPTPTDPQPQPTLRRLHACLEEDGLAWACGEYVVLDSDGVAVRNDRGLRCALGVMAARGVGVGVWSVVRL